MADGQKKEAGIRFSETMKGHLAQGVEDFEAGEKRGQEQGTALSFDVTIEIESVSDFVKLSGQEARLTGTVSYEPLGGRLPIQEGSFTLFRPDALSGKKQMTYSFWFTGKDGADYSLYGYKVVYDDPGMDLWEDMTKLFTRLYRGKGKDRTPIGSGILHFKILDLPAMLLSFEVTNTDSPIKKIQTISSFARFCYGAVGETYFTGFLYNTRYENLVLRGKLLSKENRVHDFFFFSGIHDKDFPWGDGEIFWDIALIIQKRDGTWERYALTDRMIDQLELDVENGVYRYEGPIYQLVEGYRVSKADLEKTSLPRHLSKKNVKIEIPFNAKPYPTVDIPFPPISSFERLVPHESLEKVKEILRRLGSLGFHLTPHKVAVLGGKITLQEGATEETYTLKAEETLGEAEVSTFKNFRWPTLYYNYFCALDPGSDRIYVKVRSDVFRKNRTDYLKDATEQLFGKIVSRIASMDLDIQADQSKMLSGDDAISFRMVDENLLEINNDHFPTATFQRRIVAMTDEQGRIFHALEEDMDPHILRSIHSDRVVTVAAARDSDKFKALNSVLEATDFFHKLDTA